MTEPAMTNQTITLIHGENGVAVALGRDTLLESAPPLTAAAAALDALQSLTEPGVPASGPDPDPDPPAPEPDAAPIQPHDITVQIGDTVVFESASSKPFAEWSGGRLMTVGNNYSGVFRAVKTGPGVVRQRDNAGTMQYVQLTIVADDGRPARTYTADGVRPSGDQSGDQSGDPSDGDSDNDASSGGDSTPPANGAAPPPAPGGAAPDTIARVQILSEPGPTAEITFDYDNKTTAFSTQPGERARGATAAGDASPVTVFNDPVVGASIENALLSCPGTLAGHLRVRIGGEAAFEGDVAIGAHTKTRPVRNFDPVPLKDPIRALFWNYAEQAKGANWRASYNAGDNSITGNSYLRKKLGDTGEDTTLGPRIGSDAAWMCDPANPDLLAITRGVGDAVNVEPFHFIDDKTLRIVDPADYPRITDLPAADSWRNPIAHIGSTTNLNMSQAAAHAPGYGVGAYAAYGSETDRQNMIAWAIYVMRLWQNPGFCAGGGASAMTWFHGQTRGHARALRVLVDALIVDPKNPVLNRLIADHAKSCNQFYAKRRYHTSGSYLDYNGYSTWQHDLLAAYMAYAVKHGFEDYRGPLERRVAPLPIARMMHPVPEVATMYAAARRTRDHVDLADWPAMVTETASYDHNLRAALALTSGTMDFQNAMIGPNSPGDYRAGDLDGYPWSPVGRPAILGQALALMADIDVPGAAAAFARWDGIKRCDFSWNPQYGVRPAGR